MFERLGKSQREKNVKYVASVAVFNEDGLLLFGKRGDNKKWSLPGGHFEPGEWPTQAAIRELWEETGLVPKTNIEFLGDATVNGGKIHVFAFKSIVTGEPDAALDPDEEFVEFQWVQPESIPSEIMDNLHSPKNVTLQKLGLQENTLDKSVGTFWLGSDGLKIPKLNDPKRQIWGEQYIKKAEQVYAPKGEIVFECWVDISKVRGYNSPSNKDRVKLYKRMLAGGDELPPVVLRHDGDGLSLQDGNHRQEACQQTGVQYVKALVVCGHDDLQKSVGGIAGMLAAGMLMGANPSTQPPKPTVQTIAQGAGMKVWSPEALDESMYPIAHLESSWGKNIKHAPNSGGDYHTAFGALGFKPSTAHEEWKKSKLMQTKYPNLQDPAAFMDNFKKDPKFYNLLASSHFTRLKARHGDNAHAAYAWRHGTGAAAHATMEDILKDPYVSQYNSMIGKK